MNDQQNLIDVDRDLEVLLVEEQNDRHIGKNIEIEFLFSTFSVNMCFCSLSIELRTCLGTSLRSVSYFTGKQFPVK